MPGHEHKNWDELERQFAEFKKVWPPEAWREELKAKRAFCNLAPGPETMIEILRAVLIQSRSTRSDDPTYIPAPHNWLTRRLWTEPPEAYPPRKTLIPRERNARTGFEDANQVARRKLERLAAAGNTEVQEWLREHPIRNSESGICDPPPEVPRG